MVFNFERSFINPPRPTPGASLNFCIILFIVILVVILQAVVFIIVINIGSYDVNDSIVVISGEDLHSNSAMLSMRISQSYHYLWCHISLVRTSQVGFLGGSMHLLICLSIVIGCDTLGLNVICPMLMAVDLGKVPVLCSCAILIILV